MDHSKIPGKAPPQGTIMERRAENAPMNTIAETPSIRSSTMVPNIGARLSGNRFMRWTPFTKSPLTAPGSAILKKLPTRLSFRVCKNPRSASWVLSKTCQRSAPDRVFRVMKTRQRKRVLGEATIFRKLSAVMRPFR
jgi:hypothetical protein